MKKRSTFSIVIRLISLLGKYLGLVAIAALNGTLGFILAMNISIFGGLAIMKFLDMFSGISYEVLFAIIIVSGFMRGVLRYVEQYFNHFLAFKLLAFLRHKIFDKLCRISLNRMDDKNKAEIVSVIQADVETLEIFYAHTLSPFLIAFFTCAAVVIFISIFVHPFIGLAFIAGYLIIGLLIPYIFHKCNGKFGVNYRTKLAKTKAFVNGSIYGKNDIILNNNQNKQIKQINQMSDELLKDNKKLDWNNVVFKNITLFIIIVLNIAIVLIGWAMVQNNILVNYRILLAFITFISSFGPVIALASLPYNLSMTFGSARRIFDILDEQELKTNNRIKKLNFNKIEFSDVSFSYNDVKVLENINMKISKNQIIGINGPSGCGKSTLLKLIMRFYETGSGTIKINDNNINDYSYESLYNNINLFSQSTYLFKDTIWNNLIIAKPNATKKEVIDACKKANIYDFILNSEKGFNTQISELVDNLSSGEKQRIGLARVILKAPKLLLLDEATSNIDALNEASILKTLKDLKKDMAIIIVSHRLSTLSICDTIYKINNHTLKRIN